MRIRRATIEDLDRIMEIYRCAQDFMIRSGNPTQWGHFYPTWELLADDIRQETCFVLTQNQEIHGVFVLRFGEEPTYRVIEDGQWLNDAPYVTIHRLASDGSVHGVFRACMDFCLQHCDNVRVDTHADNLPMQRAVEAFGFQRCGIIHVANGTPRLAYQFSAGTKKQQNYVYLLRCTDGTLYCGWTTDLDSRVKAHNSGKGAKYTRSRLPVELVYSEAYEDRHDALSREWHLKRLSREEKLALISNGNSPRSCMSQEESSVYITTSSAD